MAFIYNLTDTWNSGATTFAGIKMAVTNTASGASSKLLDLTVSGSTTGSFSVDRSGNGAFSGDLGVGTATAAARLDVRGANALFGDGTTDATSKTARLCVPHYTNAEAPAMFIASASTSTITSVLVGGGSASYNAATQIQFYTAADTTTLTGTERARFSSSGTLSIGTTSGGTVSLLLAGNAPAAAAARSIQAQQTFTSSTTTNAAVIATFPAVQDAVFTLPNLFHISVSQGTFGASATVTNQFGIRIESTLTGATNNYGIFSNIASGTGRWNFYAGGTASNYFAGNTAIGTTSFGTSADKVLALGTGTAPTTGPADTIQIYSTDLSAGNTMLSLFTEGTPVNVNATAAATHRIAIRVNGTVYYLLANTSA